MGLLEALGLPAQVAQAQVGPTRPVVNAPPPPDNSTLVPPIASADAPSAAPPAPRPRGGQGPREKTVGQGEFIGNKGVLVFDYPPGQASLSPNQERVLLSQQVKFSTRGAKIHVIGHSSSEENAAVAQQRADAVAAFLRADPKHPVPEGNILEVKGVGASQPIAKEDAKSKDNEKNRQRNRSVEVKLISSKEFLEEAPGDVKPEGLDKNAPKVSHKESDAVGYADITAAVIAGVFEGTVGAFVAEFVAPFALMLHHALAWQEATAGQQRIAFADGMTNAADAARERIGKGQARVSYADVESASMPSINDMTYFPANTGEAMQAASIGIKAGVDAFDPAMEKTEVFVRATLQKRKKLEGAALQKVYDKIIGDMRYHVAYALADAIKAEAKKIRRG